MQIEDSISNGANLSPHTRQVALVICSSANSFIELPFLLLLILTYHRGLTILGGAYWLMMNQPANTLYNATIASPIASSDVISISYLLLSNNLNLTHPTDNFCHLGRF